MIGTPLFRTQTVTAASAAQVGETGARRLRAFLLYSASADATVEFKNAATDTGTVLLTANAIAKTSLFVDLADVGGLDFSTAIFCKPAGSGVICYVWFE
jgi:hypothetical protein